MVRARTSARGDSVASVSAAVVVVVLVGGAPFGDEVGQGLRDALQAALDPPSKIVIEAGRGDADIEAAGAAHHADATASVVWTDPSHAHLRVFVAATSTVADREIAFAESDSSEVRGRAVGFVVATIVTAASREPELPSPPPPPAAASSNVVGEPRFAVDASFASVFGLRGSATSYGGDVGLRARLTPWLRARGGAMFGAASIDEAGASSTSLRFKLGGVADLLRSAPVLALRFDLVAIRHAVASADGSDARWIPAIAPSVEMRWPFAERWAVVGDVGVEVAAGRTRVLVGDEEKAVIPLLRIVASAGATLAF